MFDYGHKLYRLLTLASLIIQASRKILSYLSFGIFFAEIDMIMLDLIIGLHSLMNRREKCLETS